jgi:hypothetical protein
MRTIREWKLGLLLLSLGTVALGCTLHGPLLGGGIRGSTGGSEDPIAPPGARYEITVDWAGKSTGALPSPGADVTFAWVHVPLGSLVRLEVFRNNALYETTLLNYAADAGACTWAIPLDIGLQDADYFQAKLTVVDGAVQTTILDERYSPPFQIVRAGSSGGLTDVAVDARQVTITLTDDGSLVDGDRVDVYLNGVKVVANHTLVGGSGTVFTLDLQSGSNELRVTALNEGTSSPNTAQLRISDVTAGAPVQSWRLLTGESGSLVIFCTG